MPRIELDWEEGIFRGLLALRRRMRSGGEPDPGPTRAARYADHRDALSVMIQILVGHPVRIDVGRGVGGVRGETILLPAEFDLSDDPVLNRELFAVRACVAATMLELSRGTTPPRDRLENALASLRLANRAIDRCRREWPRFAEHHHRARTLCLERRPPLESFRGVERTIEFARRAALEGDRPWEHDDIARAWSGVRSRGPRSPGIEIWGDWIPDASEVEELPAPGALPARRDGDSEFEAPASDELRRVHLTPEDQQTAVPMNVFEKTETVDRYRGGARDTDGGDELEAHLEALQEADLGDLFRSNDPVHSVLRADLGLQIQVPDAAESDSLGGIRYDEWDVRRKRYRRDWCTVVPRRWSEREPSWGLESRRRNARLVDDLRRRIEIHRTGLSPTLRQRDGEEVDVDAAIHAHAERRAGLNSDGRLYIRQRRRRRDIATTVLIDLSLSTDSWIENVRVLDVSRDSVVVLGEVCEKLGDRFRVLAFASQTRNRCDVWELKSWTDPWPEARDRLGTLTPRGYTRLGPALRHATATLTREPAEKRLLIVITDGKPTDYDRYEGRYGIADVRQAVREAERSLVSVHALAIDGVARETVPSLFGPGGWDVLPHPELLPAALATAYGRLSSR